MAGITSKVCGSILLYLRRRQYKRLGGSSNSKLAKRKNSKNLRLGGGHIRRSLKLGAISRIRLKVLSPARFLARWRDAYMDTMLAWAGGMGRPSQLSWSGSNSELWAKRMPRARQIVDRDGPTDFEQRMIAYIYRSMFATPEPVAEIAAY